MKCRREDYSSIQTTLKSLYLHNKQEQFRNIPVNTSILSPLKKKCIKETIHSDNGYNSLLITWATRSGHRTQQ